MPVPPVAVIQSRKFTQSVYTKGFGLSATPDPLIYSSKDTNPKVINVYDPYTLRTPSKLTGSFAYIFGKRGLFSLDYAIKNYTGMQFGPANQFNNSNNNTNNNIKNELTNSSNELRLGAEYKVKQWSLRGGLRHEGSPYNDKKIMGDLKGFSTGLGYNFGNTKLDLAYSRAERTSQQSFFNQGLLDRATINSVFNNVTVTIGFEL